MLDFSPIQSHTYDVADGKTSTLIIHANAPRLAMSLRMGALVHLVVQAPLLCKNKPARFVTAAMKLRISRSITCR